MHTKIVRGLSIRDASLFDQPHSLKLELACKLPPLHDPPPVPSRHLNSVSAEPAAGHWLPISSGPSRRSAWLRSPQLFHRLPLSLQGKRCGDPTFPRHWRSASVTISE